MTNRTLQNNNYFFLTFSDTAEGKEESTNYCRICMDAAIDCVLLDCGHMVTCCKCGNKLAECPMCRKTIAKVQLVFQ